MHSSTLKSKSGHIKCPVVQPIQYFEFYSSDPSSTFEWLSNLGFVIATNDCHQCLQVFTLNRIRLAYFISKFSRPRVAYFDITGDSKLRQTLMDRGARSILTPGFMEKVSIFDPDGNQFYFCSFFQKKKEIILPSASDMRIP